MPRQSKERVTTLHEVSISLAKFEKRLTCHIDADERDRFVAALEDAREEPLSFYGFQLVDGLDCYVNLSHVTKINVLDYIAGLPFKKPPEKTEAEWEHHFREREESEDSVILRIWTAPDQEIEVFHEVDYGEWMLISHAFDETGQQFIGFTDEDEERVMFSIAHIAAIEVFDTHYLSEADIERGLSEKDD
jgi:hypothetical protein